MQVGQSPRHVRMSSNDKAKCLNTNDMHREAITVMTYNSNYPVCIRHLMLAGRDHSMVFLDMMRFSDHPLPRHARTSIQHELAANHSEKEERAVFLED